MTYRSIFTLMAVFATLGVALKVLQAFRPSSELTAELPIHSVLFVSGERGLVTGHERVIRGPGGAYATGALDFWEARRRTNSLPFTKQLHSDTDSLHSMGAPGRLELSPDRKLLLVGNHNASSLAVLDVSTRRWLFARKEPAGPPSQRNRVAGFSRDGQRVFYLQVKANYRGRRLAPGDLAVTAGDPKLITLDARNGRTIRSVTLSLKAEEWPSRLVVLPGDSMVACLCHAGGDNTGSTGPTWITFFNTSTGKRLRTFSATSLVDLTVTPEGRTVAALDESGALHLWDLASGKETQVAGGRVGPRWSGAVLGGRFLTVSPDGAWAVGRSGNRVALWDLRKRRLARFVGGPIEALQDLAFSPDSKTLAVADGSPTLRCWSISH